VFGIHIRIRLIEAWQLKNGLGKFLVLKLAEQIVINGKFEDEIKLLLNFCAENCHKFLELYSSVLLNHKRNLTARSTLTQSILTPSHN
jgi:hypothetical protein